MIGKKDSYSGQPEWHLEFSYAPEFPYPFPIVPEGTREKHDAVGHLSNDGRVHILNVGIIEQLVRAGLRMRAGLPGNGTKSGGGFSILRCAPRGDERFHGFGRAEKNS